MNIQLFTDSCNTSRENSKLKLRRSCALQNIMPPFVKAQLMPGWTLYWKNPFLQELLGHAQEMKRNPHHFMIPCLSQDFMVLDKIQPNNSFFQNAGQNLLLWVYKHRLQLKKTKQKCFWKHEADESKIIPDVGLKLVRTPRSSPRSLFS